MQLSQKKLYYKIGEACEIVGVEAHVLRYWETEFPNLSPPKSKSGQRTYRPKDIDLLCQIRKLLYEDGFTIAGARKQLSEGVSAKRQRASASKAPKSAPDGDKKKDRKLPTERLGKIRAELENILTLLNRE